PPIPRSGSRSVFGAHFSNAKGQRSAQALENSCRAMAKCKEIDLISNPEDCETGRMCLSDPTSPVENHARNCLCLRGRWTSRLFCWLLISGFLTVGAQGQQHSYAWQEIRDKFEATN